MHSTAVQNRVMSLLQDFQNNLHATEPRTNISTIDTPANGNPVETAARYVGAVKEAIGELMQPNRIDSTEQVSYLMPSNVLDKLQALSIPRPVNGLDANAHHIRNLSSAIHQAETGSMIACNGSVPLAGLDSPLVLRFDVSDDVARRLDLTKLSHQPATLTKQIEGLVRCCQEATFGYQGRDVLDKSYRHALKMEPSQFDINFHPFDHGIVDAINCILLPKRGVGVFAASLYKLNVYGPGGKFKSHVDTPRSTQQFGSLVVCLPSEHSGGELVIRHQSQAQEYRWGDTTSVLQWAAFYSDCEHEVMEVTRGFRVTLTYNLFWSATIKPLANPSLQLSSLPIYSEVRGALQDPSFLYKGGLLGFHCGHLYPRNRLGSNEGVPFCLKGVDRVLWLVLKELGLLCGLHIVYDQEEINTMRDEYEEEQMWGENDQGSTMFEDHDGTRGVAGRAKIEETSGSSDSDTSLASNEDMRYYKNQVLTNRKRPALRYVTNLYGLDPALTPVETFEERLQHVLNVRQIQGFAAGKKGPPEESRKLFRKKGRGRDQIHSKFEDIGLDSHAAQDAEETAEVSVTKNINNCSTNHCF